MTGIWQIFTRALESLKIGAWMGSFYPKQKMHELKIYRGRMTIKNDAKFEKEFTFCFKRGILQIFTGRKIAISL